MLSYVKGGRDDGPGERSATVGAKKAKGERSGNDAQSIDETQRRGKTLFHFSLLRIE